MGHPALLGTPPRVGTTRKLEELFGCILGRKDDNL